VPNPLGDSTPGRGGASRVLGTLRWHRIGGGPDRATPDLHGTGRDRCQLDQLRSRRRRPAGHRRRQHQKPVASLSVKPTQLVERRRACRLHWDQSGPEESGSRYLRGCRRRDRDHQASADPRRRRPCGLFASPSSFSPDGSTLAISRQWRERPAAVAIRLDGSGEAVLAQNAGAPVYSPDGSRLALTTIGKRRTIRLHPALPSPGRSLLTWSRRFDHGDQSRRQLKDQGAVGAKGDSVRSHLAAGSWARGRADQLLIAVWTAA
jgi:hypothetical protein